MEHLVPAMLPSKAHLGLLGLIDACVLLPPGIAATTPIHVVSQHSVFWKSDSLVQILEEQRQFPQRFARRFHQPEKGKPFSLPDEAFGRNVVEIVFVLSVFVLKCLHSHHPRSDSASVAARRGTSSDRFFLLLFFFFTVNRTTNRVQTPSLPYESSFVCPRCVNF